MSAGELAGKVALVTGAAGARSIGRGIALSLARRGADVVINDIAHDDEARDRVGEIEALGRRSAFIGADVSDPHECERLVAETVHEFGRLDICCANAGVAYWQELADVTLQTLVRIAAIEYGPRGIRANAIAPGWGEDTLPRQLDPALAVHDTPTGRLVTRDDIAATVAWLLSPDAAQLSGEILRLDGGYTITRGSRPDPRLP